MLHLGFILQEQQQSEQRQLATDEKQCRSLSHSSHTDSWYVSLPYWENTETFPYSCKYWSKIRQYQSIMKDIQILSIIVPVPQNPDFRLPLRMRAFWKQCWKRRKCWLPAFSPFHTMFSTALSTSRVHIYHPFLRMFPSLVLQIFFHLALFKCNTTSDWLNRIRLAKPYGGCVQIYKIFEKKAKNILQNGQWIWSLVCLKSGLWW